MLIGRIILYFIYIKLKISYLYPIYELYRLEDERNYSYLASFKRSLFYFDFCKIV